MQAAELKDNHRRQPGASSISQESIHSTMGIAVYVYMCMDMDVLIWKKDKWKN